MTREQENLSTRNKRKAYKRFNLQKGFVLHHKDEDLMSNDIDRYIQWNDEDLIVMSRSEHAKLHQHSKAGEANRLAHIGKKASDETRRKMRESQKRSMTDERKKRISDGLKGREFSEEHRRRLSENKKAYYARKRMEEAS